MEIVWLVFGGVLVLGTLPALVELGMFLFANLVLRPWPRRSSALPEGRLTVQKIVFLVPAHNEASTVARCVTSLLATDCGPYQREVVVVADNCSDDTADQARAAGARVMERHDTSVRGKGAALHFAITPLLEEDHDAFIIIDADTVVGPEFLRVMGDEFNRGKEALQCTYLTLNADASPRIRLMNLALLSMNVFRPLGRELLGFSAGIMGNGFGLTKKLLQKVPYTANSITEDLEYHLKLIEEGHRVRFVTSTRVLADFPLSKEGAETQRARWEGGRFLIQRTFLPRLLGKVFRGQFSMVEPLFELMSLPLAYEALLLLILLFVPGYLGYALVGLAILVLQTLASVVLHGEGKDFLALLQVPGYLVWKVIRLPGTFLASKKGAQWIRTKRD